MQDQMIHCRYINDKFLKPRNYQEHTQKMLNYVNQMLLINMDIVKENHQENLDHLTTIEM